MKSPEAPTDLLTSLNNRMSSSHLQGFELRQSLRQTLLQHLHMYAQQLDVSNVFSIAPLCWYSHKNSLTSEKRCWRDSVWDLASTADANVLPVPVQSSDPRLPTSSLSSPNTWVHTNCERIVACTRNKKNASIFLETCKLLWNARVRTRR